MKTKSYGNRRSDVQCNLYDFTLISILGLNGVHFGKKSYIVLVIQIITGFVFYAMQRKFFADKD